MTWGKLRLGIIAALLSPLVHAGECSVQLYDDKRCTLPLNESRNGLPPKISFDPLFDNGWPKCFLQGCVSSAQNLFLTKDLACNASVPIIEIHTTNVCDVYDLGIKDSTYQYYIATGCCNLQDFGDASIIRPAHYALLGALCLSWALHSA
jgi:hypothetical protein